MHRGGGVLTRRRPGGSVPATSIGCCVSRPEPRGAVTMAIVPFRLTYEEFCQLPESHLPHELIDGELRMPAAPVPRHQRVTGNIYLAVRPHVEGRNLGLLELAPVDVVLDRDRPLVLQLDLLFI